MNQREHEHAPDSLPHPAVLWALVAFLLVGLVAGWFR